MHVCPIQSRRASGSVLELLEISLDCELTNNALRIQLPRAVVGDVVFVEKEVEEGVRELHVLVVTTRTFHRFVFPHPLSAPAPDAALPSVLAKVTAVDLLQGTCSLVSLRSFSFALRSFTYTRP